MIQTADKGMRELDRIGRMLSFAKSKADFMSLDKCNIPQRTNNWEESIQENMPERKIMTHDTERLPNFKSSFSL